MAVNLPANIIIGAKTTSGFDSFGGKLMNMGAMLSQFSDKILDFEKDSVEVYKNYETTMLEAEGALTTQYKSATQRARVMEELEGHVSQWAANSIFHTDDMAKAVSEAAHAGWSLEEMVEGIPVAMNLAQAGGLSLSQGLDDLIKTLNATGNGTKYAAQLVDQWTLAANSSATTVGELGEALTKMGAAARFADGTEELLALLAVLADTGTVGANAGTMLRNAMLRVVAPTTKADDAMSLLGADVDELNDVLSDESVTKAAEELKGMGFSAYDSKGKLKPMIRIFKDLDRVLNGLDEASRNEILAAIFPTRTTTAALAFLDAANGKFDELMESMKDSDGYAGRIAEIQTSGLMGSTELLLSKEEELKRRVGDVLSEPIQRAQGFLGDVLDGLNEMPTEGLSALTGAATALGVAGPGMFVGGLAVRTIAAAGPWGVGFLVAAAGAGALLGYLTKISEINFESNFGTMELDMEALAKHIDGLKTKYDEEAKALDSWTQSVAQAQSTYEKLTTEFSETLMTDTLTGKQLTDREKEDLEAYGQGIGDALVEGLNKAQARDLTFLDMLIGNAESVEESDGIALGAELINARYGRLLEEAGALGEALRQQMADAMADGIITEEERDEIVNNTIEAMNQIQAQIDARMDAQRRWEAIGRAQNVSWDSMSGYLEYMEKSLDERLAAVDERYAGEYGQVMAAFDDALKTGKPLEVNGEMITVTEADRDKVAQPILDAWERAKQAEYDLYGKEAATAFTALMHDSGAAGAWDFLNDANANGKPDYDAFDWSDFKTADLERLDEQFRVLQEVSGAALKFVPESSKYYEEIAGLLGQAAKAQEMLEHEIESRSLQATQTPVGMDEYGRTLSGADYYDTLDSLDELEQIKRNLNSAIEAKGWQNASGEIADWFAVNDRMDALEDQGTQFETLEREESAWWNDYYTGTTQMAKLRKELDAVEQEIARTEERISSKGDYRDWWYTFSNGQLRDEIKLTGVDGSGGLYARRESLTSQIAELETTATGGTEAVSAAVEEMQAAADASGGVDVGIRANGGYEAMSEQLALMQAEADRGVRVRVFTLGGAGKVTAETYAEGGRATEPSIFAEGDTAEWAIPEAHTERTRQLLIQAAKASGFDWDELLSARGGLNGDAQNVTVNTTYAPTINAGDASGVDNVLNGDKARFAHIVREAVRAALADQRLRDQVEVYV